jgi:hypothetical protein
MIIEEKISTSIMNSNDLQFTLNYAISLIIVLVVCTYLMKTVPTLHVGVVVIVGLLVAYLTIVFINYFLPSFALTTENVTQYMEYSIYSNFNDVAYFNVWPPILAVLIVFVILMYNGKISPSS